MTSDLELLGRFAREKSQDAFTALVQRHVNLVYSAALRQVRSPQLAEEVAQSVFADLAQNAGTLARGGDTTSPKGLTPWLYAVTRRTAIDVIRKESRRQLREQIAVEMNDMNATSAEWTLIEPLLDDAMAALDETDRSAVLLRYFENKSLREVGEALGSSDDAAQKRVSRAMERLREFFSKRNVTMAASGLAVLISANAVQSAPVGLAANISAAAVLTGTAVHAATIIAATKTIAMTTIQKTLVAAALAAAVGTGIFEAHQTSRLREQNQTLQQQQAALTYQLRQLQREQYDATNRLDSLLAENEQLKSNPNAIELLKLRGEITRLRNEANDPAGSAAKAWLTKVNKLKQRIEETPGTKIPEFQFLTEQDWFDATKGRLDSDADYRRALAQLRNTAKNEFAPLLSAALKKYLQANNDTFPSEVTLLQPYFDSQVDDAMLSRWDVVPAATIPNMKVGNDWIISEKAPVDDVFDSQIVIGSNGYGASDYLSWETQKVMPLVWAAFQAANNGQETSNPSQLLPYATTPEQREAVQKLILKNSANP